VNSLFRRFDHRYLAPLHDITHALERDQEWHADQTSRDENTKGDESPNRRSSTQSIPPMLCSAQQVVALEHDWLL
jgi:hypothetical protein